MTDHDWHDLVEKYIVRGEIPSLQSQWDVEAPETYLRRPYRESSEPVQLRQELIRVMNWAIQVEELLALSRALRLAKLIPHLDFAPTLQNIFFTARSRRQKEDVRDKYKEISLLAIKAMYVLQPTLPQGDERRPFWEMMWISLLKDKEYGIAAYNGLRHLNISLALEQLPLLLRRADLTPQDLGVILRGTKRDLLSQGRDATKELVATIATLTEEELLVSQPLLRDAFGDEIIDTATMKAQEDEEEELNRIVTFPVPTPDGLSPDSLRQRLFPKLAHWITERIPAFGASLWLVDQEKERVHFMGQAGLHGTEPDPPCVMKFGENVSGTVALTRQHLLSDLERSDGTPVYKRQELRDLGLHAVFSVFVRVNGTKEPPLALIVNFFDTSIEKLQQLRAPCIRNATVVARAAQQALAKYTNYWVADLTAKLTEKPVLAGVAQTVVENIGKALPCEQEHVALYLYHSDSRRLILYVVYDSKNEILTFESLLSNNSITYQPNEGLSGYVAKQASALRIFDITNESELPNAVTPNLVHLNLTDPKNTQGLSYIGLPLREPATSGFVGRLVGIIEIYRPIEKRGGRVFTPIGEFILTELLKPAVQPLITALDEELRTYEPKIFPVERQVDQQGSIGDVSRVFECAEGDFRKEARGLLDSWYVADDANQVFLAFRTLYDKCTAYWVKPGPNFNDDETAARRAFQRAILTHDALLMSSEPGVPVTHDLLLRFGVAEKHVDILLALRMVLVTLVYRGRPNGIIGLEFDSAHSVREAVKEIKKEHEGATRFVRISMMRTWLDYRRHLVSLFATFLEIFSKKAEDEQWVNKRQDFFNFVASGHADLAPIERSFGELTAWSLKRLSSDDKCVFSEECSNWRSFAKDGHLYAPNIGTAQLLAMPSAVRMVLATSTAPMLWGGTASVSLDEKEERPGWSHLRISVSANGNGHGDIKKQALALARCISEYRGWICDSEDDENGITIMLPHKTNRVDVLSF